MSADIKPNHVIERNQMVTQMRINELIVYIQKNIDQKMTLDDLAQVAGYSPFHIHRIFRAYLGETLGDFIQRLRMGKAIESLLNGAKTITEIALQSGYQTPAAFTKAFKHIYFTTPSQVRRTGIRPVASANPLIKVPEIRRIKMKAEIREMPTKKVLTVTRKGLIDNNFNKTAAEAFSVLSRFVSANRAWASVENGCLGICPDDGVEIPPEDSRYIAGYFLKESGDVWVRGEVEIMEFPAGLVAVFTHRGPYETLWQSWNRIYRDWLPSSGKKLRDAFPYEVYVNERGQVPEEDLITEIYIPIE
jgi:AraC family transcriptional regulator